MAHVYVSRVMDASADDLWTIVRTFGALDTWFPFVSKCELIGGAVEGQVGAVRSNTVAEGAIIEETLIELSDRDRRITYDVTKGDVATIDYSATLTIHEATVDDRALAVWTARFDVDGDREPVVAWVRDDIFKVCLEELERAARRLGGREN